MRLTIHKLTPPLAALALLCACEDPATGRLTDFDKTESALTDRAPAEPDAGEQAVEEKREDAGPTQADAAPEKEIPAPFDPLPDTSHLSYTIPEGALQAAEEGLERWWKDILLLDDDEKAASSRGQVMKGELTLGLPYERCGIAPTTIMTKSSAELSRNDIYCPGSIWLFGIQYRGLTVAWLSVAARKGGWRASGFGGAGNAHLTHRIEEHLSNRDADQRRLMVGVLQAPLSWIAYAEGSRDLQEAEFYRVGDSELIPTSLEEALVEAKTESAKWFKEEEKGGAR
jgi:hypothetical protein